MPFHSIKTVLLSLIILVTISGCKKEVDSTNPQTSEPTPGAPDYTTLLVPCELCAYADSLEGTFAGTASGENVPGYYAGFDIGAYTGTEDSVFVQLRHVFKPNAGSVIDSIHMFIQIKSWIKNDNNILIDTIRISDRSGNAFGGNFPTFKPRRDSVSISLYEDHGASWMHSIQYKGYRLP